jgi:topoisomerase-4 subunit A
VRKVEFKSEGLSTLTGVDIWYDKVTGRLNRDERGQYVGNFNGEDNVLVIYKGGEYEITGYEMTNRYEADKVIELTKLSDGLVVSAVHIDGESKTHYVKRFNIETNTTGKRFLFISDSKGSSLLCVSIATSPKIELTVVKGKAKEKEISEVNLDEIIEVKGWKANGNRLSQHTVKKVKLLEESNLGAAPAIKPKPETKPEKEKVDKIVTEDAREPQPALFEETAKTAKVKKSPKAKIPKPPVTKASTKKKPKDDGKGGYDIGTTIELDF